jgi:DNA modification methylase
VKVEQLPIDQITPYARNPRKNDKAIAKVAASIKEFGFRQPLVVDRDMVVVVGHSRLFAAQQLGLCEVPVHVAAELTPEQAKAYRIMDNRSAEEAEWDWDRLKLELADLEAARDFDLKLSGFESDELARMLGARSVETPENDAPPLPKKATAKRGQLWHLGEHRLFCGDATVAGDVGAVMGGRLADATITDPPYGVAYEGKAGTIKNDNLPSDGFLSFLTRAFRAAGSVMRPGAAIYVCHADTEGLAFRSALVSAGFKLASCLVWKKNAPVLGHADYQWQHEPILYGWKTGRHRFYGTRRESTVQDLGAQPLYSRRSDGAIEFYVGERVIVVHGRDLELEEHPGTLLEEPRPTRSAEHPTMKPVALFERFVLNSTKTGDAILDPFAGSGSTLIACEKLERAARLVEIDPLYADVIIARWEKFTGKKAKLAGGTTARRRRAAA